MKILDKVKPCGIVSLGDFLDGYDASSFTKDPAHKHSLMDEINAFNKLLDVWSKHLKTGEIRLITGNHEIRAYKLVAKHAKEIHEIVKPIDELLRLKERTKAGNIKFTLYPYNKWDACKIGDCVLTHGIYYGDNMITKALQKYKCNAVFGHSHRFFYGSDGDHYAVSLGHGAITDKVMHLPTKSDWQQAMGLLHVNANGKTSFEPILVNNGKAVFRGEEIKA